MPKINRHLFAVHLRAARIFKLSGHEMKLPCRQFLQLAASSLALPSLPRIAGAGLSITAGAHHRRVSFRSCTRQRRASRGSGAVAAVRLAIRRREPTGRRQSFITLFPRTEVLIDESA